MKPIALLCTFALTLTLLYGFALAQQPMCGQSSSPSSTSLGKPLVGFALSATPLKAVANPRFRIRFPTPDFFTASAPTTGLRVTVSGCVEGSDTQAVVDTVASTLTTRAGQFDGKVVTAGVACTLAVEGDGLKAPSEGFGHVLQPNNNYYNAFALDVLSNAGEAVNVGVNIAAKSSYLQISDMFKDVSFTFESAASVIKFTPSSATADAGSAGVTLTTTFSAGPVFSDAAASLTYVLSGCTASDLTGSATRVSATEATVTVAAGAMQVLKECTLRISGTGVQQPSSFALTVDVLAREAGGFKLARMFGRSLPVSTNAFTDYAFALSPASAALGSQLTAIEVSGSLPSTVATGTQLHVGFSMRNVILTGDLAPSNLVLDVTGCATASGLVMEGTANATVQTVRSSTAVTISATNAKCVFTLKPASAALRMGIYEASSSLFVSAFLLGTDQPLASTVLQNARAYNEASRAFLSLADLSVQTSSAVAGAQVTKLVLTGTPKNSMLSTENPAIGVTLPKEMNIENGKTLNVQVAGCATYGPASVTVDDKPTCEAELRVVPTGGIDRDIPCVVTVTTTGEEGGVVLRNPQFEKAATLVFRLRTLKNGNVVDFGDEEAQSSYATVNPVPAQTTSGAQGVAVTSIVLAAVTMAVMALF
jgi:hypothetical protein